MSISQVIYRVTYKDLSISNVWVPTEMHLHFCIIVTFVTE